MQGPKDKCLLLVFLMSICIQFGVAETAKSDLSYGEKYPIKLFAKLEEAPLDLQRPMLIVFFSTDCHVCSDDLFEMKYVVESNDFPVQVVGVSSEKLEYLKYFLEKYSFPYPVISDRRREIYRRFQVSSEPYKLLLLNGKVLYKDDVLKDSQKQKEEIIQCLRKLALE
jgi:peroxiredoxin